MWGQSLRNRVTNLCWQRLLGWLFASLNQTHDPWVVIPVVFGASNSVKVIAWLVWLLRIPLRPSLPCVKKVMGNVRRLAQVLRLLKGNFRQGQVLTTLKQSRVECATGRSVVVVREFATLKRPPEMARLSPLFRYEMRIKS